MSYSSGAILGIGCISLASFQQDSSSVPCWDAHSNTKAIALGVSLRVNRPAEKWRTRLPCLSGVHENEVGCVRRDN